MTKKTASTDLLVLCEGRTEVCYLRELTSFLGIEDKVQIRQSAYQNPISAVERLAKERFWDKTCGHYRSSEVWLVFDRDEHSQYLKAAEVAERLGMHPVFSRPCIEYWFLCHFPDAKQSLPIDGKLICETHRTVTTDEEGFVREKTEKLWLPVTRPDTCLAELKRLAPFYTKTQLCFLEHFAAGTRLAYGQTKGTAMDWRANGSAMPLLIDRFCSLANLSPNELFAALETAQASGSPSFNSFELRRGALFFNRQHVLRALALLETGDNNQLTEDEWIFVGNALGQLASAVKSSILSGHDSGGKKSTSANISRSERSPGRVSLAEGARDVGSYLARGTDQLEALTLEEDMEFFQSIQSLLSHTKERVEKIFRERL